MVTIYDLLLASILGICGSDASIAYPFTYIERGLTREINLYLVIKIGLSGVKFNDPCVFGGRDTVRVVEQRGELHTRSTVSARTIILVILNGFAAKRFSLIIFYWMGVSGRSRGGRCW